VRNGPRAARTFARSGAANAARRARGPRHHAAAKESLQVDDQIELAGPQPAQEREEAQGGRGRGEFRAGEFDEIVDDRTVFEQRGERIIDEPGKLGVGKPVADAVDRRQGVDDIAERTGLDDENLQPRASLRCRCASGL
jgi:hypothetical protein